MDTPTIAVKIMVSAAPVMSPVDAKRSDRMTVNNAQVDKMN